MISVKIFIIFLKVKIYPPWGKVWKVNGGRVRLEYILKWREPPLNKPPRHSKGKTNSESAPRPEATYQSGIVHSTRPKGLVEWVPSLTTRVTVVPFSLPMSEQERTLIHNNENLFRTSRQR